MDKVTTCIRLTQEAYEKLRRLAYEQNLSQAKIVENLIKAVKR